MALDERLGHSPTSASSQPQELVLPRLRSIQIRTSTTSGVELALLLLSPSLTHLAWTSYVPQTATDTATVLAQLSFTCPNLQECKLDWHPLWPDTGSSKLDWDLALGDFLQSLPRLQKLTTRGPLNQHHLTILSNSSIQDIVWTGWAEMDFGGQQVGFPGNFPALRHLEGMFLELKSLTGLLEQSSILQKIQNAKLSVKTASNFGDGSIRRLFSSLADQHTTLQSLQLTLWCDRPSTFRMKPLLPLTKCTNLTVLSFIYDGTLSISDREFEQFIRKLTKLKRITIMPYRFDIHTLPPSLTLKCLTSLQRHCLDVEYIDIFVDAEQCDDLGQESINGAEEKVAPLKHLTTLGFGLSPIPVAGSVLIARFLRSLTAQPRLRWEKIWSSVAPNYFEFKRRRVMWAKVEKLLVQDDLNWLVPSAGVSS
jgi:hypothetical protein